MIQHLHYNSPNTLEDALVQATRSHSKGLLGCYEQSIVTGNPVNLVNDTHGNRHGRFHFRSSEELNDLYLKGERLTIPPIDPKIINAAHYEFELGV